MEIASLAAARRDGGNGLAASRMRGETAVLQTRMRCQRLHGRAAGRLHGETAAADGVILPFSDICQAQAGRLNEGTGVGPVLPWQVGWSAWGDSEWNGG
jgi:hypothetical protein